MNWGRALSGRPFASAGILFLLLLVSSCRRSGDDASTPAVRQTPQREPAPVVSGSSEGLSRTETPSPSPVAAEPSPGRLVAHLHYLRGDHSVAVWLDASGFAHQKDDAQLTDRPLTAAESASIRQLAAEVALCSVSGRYGPEYSRDGNLNWVKLSVEADAGACYADVYDLDATRMSSDEIQKAQRVLRMAIGLRRLFPDAYRREEQAVDETFLALGQRQ